MLGRDAATVAVDHCEQIQAHLPAALKELFNAKVAGLQDVQMQVAVADVTEPHDFEVRIRIVDERRRLGEECRNARDAHRDVVLVRREVGQALGNVFA